ncbi:hypothetical protein [Saccharopolyspora hattusasensis]
MRLRPGYGVSFELDERSRRAATVNLGLPSFRDIASRTVTATKNKAD